MDNFPPLNSQNNNSTPGGRNVPPPPPPPIAIRTMDSDVKSMAQAGGGSPMPQRFDLSQQPLAAKPMPMPEASKEVKINIPGYEGPEEKLFSPGTLADTKEVVGTKKTSGSRTILYVVIFVVVAGGLGAAGYFLYPIFFPAVTPLPLPSATTTPTVTPPTTPAAIKHVSFITAPGGATAPVLSLAQVVPPTIASGTKPILKEVILQDASGNQPSFSKYFSSLVSDFLESDLRAIFSDDFTAFIYYTGQGAWPGYVAKLKDGVSADAVLNMEKRMEAFSTLANLFLSSPGDKSPAGFKNGNLNGTPSRYLTFSVKDAAINYSIIGNYFLIGTNYTGVTEAAKGLITSTSTSTISPNL